MKQHYCRVLIIDNLLKETIFYKYEELQKRIKECRKTFGDDFTGKTLEFKIRQRKNGENIEIFIESKSIEIINVCYKYLSFEINELPDIFTITTNDMINTLKPINK